VIKPRCPLRGSRFRISRDCGAIFSPRRGEEEAMPETKRRLRLMYPEPCVATMIPVTPLVHYRRSRRHSIDFSWLGHLRGSRQPVRLSIPTGLVRA
jgi:hypothetical protein